MYYLAVTEFKKHSIEAEKTEIAHTWGEYFK